MRAAVWVGIVIMSAGVTAGCGDAGEDGGSYGQREISAEEAAAIDDAAALERCFEGYERARLGDAVELPGGARVIVHELDTGHTAEELGNVRWFALADIELCAGDSLELDSPFTNRSAFALCESYVWEAEEGGLERIATWGSPDFMHSLREPALASVVEDIAPGACERGWVTVRSAEGEPGWRPYAIVYNTEEYSDYPDDRVRIAWALE